MKIIAKTLASTLLLTSLLTGCNDDAGLGGDDDPMPQPDMAPAPDAPPGITLVDVPAGDITGDTRWTADTIYTLKGYVFVTSGTLTIEAGTTIKGDNGSALTITKDARLVANGTADKPIVFTSSATVPMSGDWGGVVLQGKAPINVTGGTNKVEGFPDSYGDRIVYGGTNAAHDCGSLKYARIEYAGFQLAVDNELNGLTLAACGTGTTVDYVQAHFGLDDGVEVFGGTVNLSHIVVSAPDDDAIDWDLGWTGKLQFLVVQQRNGRGDKGVEADSNRNDNELLPRSAPEIWNATFIGSDGAPADVQGGLHLRRGTAGKLSNAIVAYFPKFAIDVDGSSSTAQANASALSVQHTYFMKAAASELWPTNFDANGMGVQNDCISGVCLDEAAVFSAVATNKINVDPQLADPKHLTAPNWKPNTGSPVLTGCGTPPAGLDQTATFCGAIGATDWTLGWTKY